ncbi:MAG: ADP-glyceromanno-heptose 6-epimerase [Gammaproteobacteria bacterium]|nr:ADP-glyceromanno-heptose 6-epimerase [Gammaproteobacteria bacterium]MCP4476174.1 ADP-glyceromanno-heptose 6-epimerase [Gammaproteobacteria bacterium]
MIIVTGGAGFIGSRLVKALEVRGERVVIVDELEMGRKFTNIVDCNPYDYIDSGDLSRYLTNSEEGFNISEIKAVFHQGACVDTTEWDGQYMLDSNYEYSKQLLHFCLKHKIPFYYASSAAVYGGGKVFKEERQYERPLNVYGYSKWLFDNYVRQRIDTFDSQVIGLRYFNVYGPGETHKDDMASVAYKHNEQMQQQEYVELFAGSDQYGDGEQRRDFVYVDDVVNVNLWFFDNHQHSGIFNVGTGRAQSFNELARAVINWHGKGEIRYIPFPERLKGHYQSFTEADISKLRTIGYEAPFKTVEEGVKLYLTEIN